MEDSADALRRLLRLVLGRHLLATLNALLMDLVVLVLPVVFSRLLIEVFLRFLLVIGALPLLVVGFKVVLRRVDFLIGFVFLFVLGFPIFEVRSRLPILKPVLSVCFLHL